MTHNLKAKQAAPATPLPWRSKADFISVRVIAAHGAQVAGTVPLAELDAAYIVAACNAFPELVAALRNSLEVVDYVANNGNAGCDELARQIRALLRKLGAE